jgi:hypothetical protein
MEIGTEGVRHSLGARLNTLTPTTGRKEVRGPEHRCVDANASGIRVGLSVGRCRKRCIALRCVFPREPFLAGSPILSAPTVAEAECRAVSKDMAWYARTDF